MRHVIRYTLLTLICLGLVLALLTGLVLGALQYRVHANLQRYEDRPKVTGLPADWPGNRDFQPYQGPHPSQMETPADPVSYPLPLGSVGPVAPLRAGPNTYPLLCTIESSWLGQPVVDNQEGAGMAVYAEDANGKPTPEVIGYSKDCLFRSRAWYFYKRAGTDEFHPLEDAHDDIERITLNGEETDFVVRVEMGTINRYLYLVAALRGPQETDIAKPDPRHWNGRLIYRLRGGVGIGRRQGRIHPMGMLRDRAAELALGYAMVYSTANQTSNHYDIWLAADTAQRVKRQFTALYGQPRYTVGIGGSGGGLEQYLFAQNHPGLLDALIPLYSYPDMITQTIYTLDCELLEYYFDVTDGANPRWHDWGNRRWIQGLNALSRADNPFAGGYVLYRLLHGQWPYWVRGNSECVRSWRGPAPIVHNPRFIHFYPRFHPSVFERVHWSFWESLVYLFGVDEQGYARHTWSNEGVQYGLQALRDGQLSAREFLDLNARIGSWKPQHEMQPVRYWNYAGDSSITELAPWSEHNMRLSPDHGHTPAPRETGDIAAMQAAYRAGLVFEGNIDVPVIDLRHYLEDALDMHHLSASFATRARLIRARGNADNQLIWVTRKPHVPIPQAFAVMDAWMQRILEDPQRRVAANKPADAVDRCYDEGGHVIAEGAEVWSGAWNDKPAGACLARYPMFSTSRMVAGDSLHGDVFKCALQSVDSALARGLYAPVDMHLYRERLQVIFPTGVCDYTQPDQGRPLE